MELFTCIISEKKKHPRQKKKKSQNDRRAGKVVVADDSYCHFVAYLSCSSGVYSAIRI
jgi:hypothetical protein